MENATSMKRGTNRVACGAWIGAAAGVGLLLGVAAPLAHAEIIVDQLSTVRTGTWNFRDNSSGGWTNADRNYYNDLGTHFAFGGASATATSTAILPEDGIWSVEFWMPTRSATSNTLMTVEQGLESTSFRVNQNDGDGRWAGQWMSMGTYLFDAGSVNVIQDNDGAGSGANNVASMTGAVRFARVEDGMTPYIQHSSLGPVGSVGEFYTEVSGSWINSTHNNPLWGTNRISDSPNAEAVFTAMPLAAGLYDLDLVWTPDSNRTSSALLSFSDLFGDVHDLFINMQNTPGSGGDPWEPLGGFWIDGSTEFSLTNAAGSGFLSANAMRLTFLEPMQEPAAIIPEPGSALLAGLGALVVLVRRRRRS